MTVGHGTADGRVRQDLQTLLPNGKSIHAVSLRTPTGERRFPVDFLRDDVQPLPSTAWVAFHGEELGDSPAYAADLMRRLMLVRCNWLAQASLQFPERTDLVALAEQSHCRGLLFDGERICSQYLTPDSTTPPEALAQLTQSLHHLAERGLFTIVRFVLGYDTDDESVFERVARFCLEARIGLPLFSIVSPQPESPLFAALDQAGRLRHKDFTQYDGAHVVFQPKLMTPEALENGLHWARQHVYTIGAIWRRVFSWNPDVFQQLLTNYQQRRLFQHEPQGIYTEAMQLLRQLAQPIPVQEQGSFISPLKDAVGETKRQLHGALLRVRAVRDAHLHALTLRLEGVLDASGANEVLKRIHEAIRAGHQKVVLDLNGLELVSQTVLTRFLEENATALMALRGHVVFRHLRTALDAIKANLGGALPNAELFDLATEEG
jgi:hypothetical protein